ncbi:MAG TPA: 3-keto-5-aminohexanoate cleavage protein [Polyangia bacterium]|nr:3-keto-5-aminohexanoate cleavage protein [Polyangia bacterium]
MALGDKVVITCAVTGAVTTKRQCAAIPYTAVEIGEECRRAYEAGATVVHVHGRTDDGQPSYDEKVFEAYKREIEARSPVIINFSTGAVGLTKEQRINHVLKTRPHIGALNMGSMNYSKYSSKRKAFVFSFVFANPFDEIVYYLQQMNEAGVRPECECFDTGHVESLEPLLDMGLLKGPIDINIVLGVMGGAPSTPDHLNFIATHLPKGSVWKTTPISQATWPLTSMALGMGGNVRVGLEDNFYLPTGEMVKSNGELVAQAALMAKAAGRPIATVEETKQILGITR